MDIPEDWIEAAERAARNIVADPSLAKDAVNTAVSRLSRQRRNVTKPLLIHAAQCSAVDLNKDEARWHQSKADYAQRGRAAIWNQSEQDQSRIISDAELPPQLEQVLLMVLSGASFVEIGRKIGRSPKYAANLCRRALTHFRRTT